MPLPPRSRVLILDLGDVLFSWSPVTSTSITPKMLKYFLSSSVWREFECGRLSEDECYRLVGEKFALNSGEVRQAILDARASLQPDNSFMDFIRKLQAETEGALRIFAMSNISAPDFAVARGKPADWSIFERVFTSADARMRKPDLTFFKFVLEEIKVESSSVVFVDDSIENVLAARSLGINGIVFDDVKRVRQALRYFVCDPVSRGQTFLEERAGRLESENNIGENVSENFAQLLILEATGNRKLVNYVHHSRTWNFFREISILPDKFPEDLDTTSIGLTVVHPDDHVVNSVLDEMLQFVREDGITMTYFDPERLRTDPVVALNVLSLLYSRGRGHELAHTLDWVLGVLEHRAYLDGTRYYETAECFLFFATRLLRSTENASLHERLAQLLRARILERDGCSGDALALATRVLAGAVVGLRMERELAALLSLQCEDGGWDASWVYKFGTSGIKIGNRGLTTALALNAIAALYPQAEDSGNTVAIAVGPPAALEVTTALGELTATAFPSPLTSLRPKVPKETGGEGLSVDSVGYGVNMNLFPSNVPPSPQVIVA
ncbi:Haloacid dehalogenase-like hydrolase-domain-containing protein [Russula earlei]|uniref:Haloacid dehalogenase-like hydrolase-domain-containing protein n=1 Tax=Russula earlei TaxID=71964 RepID=A0ACC0U3J2_9AGAM|nr:Haloacid dehalogenase-like hydrolase-domain-containing protein [Russula earlei]